MGKLKKVYIFLLLTIWLVLVLMFLLAHIFVKSDDNEFHSKERSYLDYVGNRVANYYLENNKLPVSLKQINVSENYPYPSIKLLNLVDFKRDQDYKILYHPIEDNNFTLVMTNQRLLFYYYSDNWDFYKSDGRFIMHGRAVYLSAPYKSEQFFQDRKNPPFNQVSSWPDI